MTEPVATPPPLNLPLMTLDELEVWNQSPISEDQHPFAHKVIEGVSVVVREAGSSWWVHEPDLDVVLPAGHVRIPYRAKLIVDLKAKNFFQHPTGAVSETTGPISERYLDEVVQQIQLSDAEAALLAQLAASGGDPAVASGVQGIWALSTFRGPLETHQRVSGVITVPYWRPGSKDIPYYAYGALGSPE